MFLRKLWRLLFHWREDLRARVSKYLVTREVVRVLEVTHAEELKNTPRNEWSLVRQKQISEIQAVQSGQVFDIVDRRSWAFPYLPEALHRLNQPVLKNTPYALRRFSETPIPRRAMNLVKNSVLSFKWQIKPTKDFTDDENGDREKRIHIATETLKRPNNTGESFRDLLEQMVEDFLLNGAAVAEHRATPYAKRPTKFWAVDSSTLRIFLDWTESTPDRPRYAQMTGLKGERGIVTFLTDELMYIRDNIRTATPFGLGRLEVAFNAVNSFLGVQEMSGRAGSDQIHKTWLWWEQTVSTAKIQEVRRHVMNEIEGQSKLSLIAGLKKPDVVDVTPVTVDDLLLDWQKFLIEIIAAAFDLSPQALNMTENANRSTAQVMAVSDWRNAVVPVATRFQTAFTRQWIHDDLGWKDLEFEFSNLDDPDPVIRVAVQQKLYMMDSITSDEIRKANDMSPLPGPWGKLTQMQKQLLLVEAQAKLTGSATGAPGGSPGGGGGMGSSSGGMTGGGGGGRGGTGAPGGSIGSTSMQFSAQDIAQMDPGTIQLYQELGILPQGQQLPQQMEQQQPGILDQISDELREYFQTEKQAELEEEVLPDPVTKVDEQLQLDKFQEDSHQESLAEKTINRRGVFGPSINQQIRKNPERGKYPRSGGRFLDQEGKDRVNDVPMKTGKPKKRLKPGKNNPYQ
jgi:uncharacterized membrane protein YgcG